MPANLSFEPATYSERRRSQASPRPILPTPSPNQREAVGSKRAAPLILWTVIFALIAIASAWAGWASAWRGARALFGGLSAFSVCAVFFFWIIHRAYVVSRSDDWASTAVAIFTLMLATTLYWFGPSWAGLMTCIAVAPATAGAIALRDRLLSQGANSRKPQG